MDFWEMVKAEGDTPPPAIYIIDEIRRKNGFIHCIDEEVIGRPAYPVAVEVGHSAYIKYMPNGGRKYRWLETSMVKSFTPWKDGESIVEIETMNTTYILKKRETGHVVCNTV